MLSLLSLALIPLALSLPFQRAPLPRIVGTESCTPLTSGILTGESLSNPQNFFLWGTGNVLYYGGSDGLEVQFQACSPNFEAFTNNATFATGHLYVPYISKCLSVDPPNGPPPHVLQAEDCTYNEDSGQILQQWWMRNGTEGVEYVWAGYTDNLGSVQNAPTCQGGTFGFLLPDVDQPLTGGEVEVVCMSEEGARGFRIEPQN
ncbi:hypothetical protein DACRYDRAFT_25577 [Dacryopinax primogenitus]|uniref:Ricin B lectin domain-containing protein n=1 Tax=Dacryopinax primogenitus (strain DJM 731) TaxID=1858805 RepID=M5FPZ3_DACPD|nr:uncharacterized protein DACRYDRAFT_25577 [Dacryopinax primogenitus]EJT96639.1 hypothetical protein DACRYDRAFT_25577 [Dacryopinax primogenitus]